MYICTLSRIVTVREEMKRKTNCLMNQVVHSTHNWRPIMNMDSRIRVSFSSTSSCGVETYTYSAQLMLMDAIFYSRGIDQQGCLYTGTREQHIGLRPA